MPTHKKRNAPKHGATYQKAYKGETYTLKVVRTDNGVGFSLGGKVFNTPSAAAKSITQVEVNGWRFWGID